MPAIAVALFLVGLMPFVALAFGAVGPVADAAAHLLRALIDYAALVLGFMGGVHWGLAMTPSAARPSVRFTAGIVPLLFAWVVLWLARFIAPLVALALLILGYLAIMLAEHRASQGAFVPPGYVWARWGFTVVAMLMMAMVLALRLVGQTIVF